VRAGGYGSVGVTPTHPHARTPTLFVRAGWALLAAAAVALALWPVPASVPSGGAPERHVRIEARSFDYSPAEIRVDTGDRVTLELVAYDYAHGIYVDGYDLNVTAEPGQPGVLSFVADRPGTFRLRCSVTCGPLHPFMIGKLRVGPAWPLWRAAGLAAFGAAAALIWARRRAYAGG
jgi:heme/copper-type cytochrome/quinol oxidase subunit 2